MKYILGLTVSLICLFFTCINVNGVEISDIKPLTEKEMPVEIDFNVSSVCFGHDYFEQADADENGNFIIYSHCNAPASEEEKTFRTKYIDVYDKTRQLICEICFTTPSPISARILNNAVYIVMRNEMIVYDYINDIAVYYTFMGNSVWETSVGEISQEREFSVGEYNYKCEYGSNMDFVKFIRFDGQTEETLIEMPGAKSIFGQIILYFSKTIFVSLFVAVIIIFTPKILKRIKSKKIYTGETQ